ncbi:sensor histidine kinase [Nonomuraea purpurea]|uniref:histidine kinase n=1 Tax=Nonomuraea purpurea TaxID=1849276 RepID=A0ABV8GMH4_9ACTN
MRAKVVSSLRRLAVVNPFLLDLALGVAVAGAALAVRTDNSGYALVLVAGLVLAWRRRAPLTVLLVSCGAAAAVHTTGHGFTPADVAPLLALCTVAGRRPPAVSIPCALPVIAVWWYAAPLGPDRFAWPNVLPAVVVVALAWTSGNGVRMLAVLAERLRQERAERAVVEERLRIACELHDVVAHHMSVILLYTGLAQHLFVSDPVAARSALATIADTGKDVMDDMRRLQSVMGAGSDGIYDPAPGLQRLEQLTERVRSVGVPVEVSITGTVHPLPPGMDLCAYWIVRECLTNVLKHAGPARAWLSLHYGAELKLRVHDDGRGAAAGSRQGGHGLIGMRERVKLYEGTIRAGPKPSGGFEVVITLPLSPSTR